MHTNYLLEDKNVEITTNNNSDCADIPVKSIKVTFYKYSQLEKNAILHFNKDNRYTITE